VVAVNNKRPRSVDAKDKRDEALNLADFKIDDILSMPGDRLLVEIGEDFGDPARLAAEFDVIAFALLSGRHDSAVDPGQAGATSVAQPAGADVGSTRAPLAITPAAPWSFRWAALAAAKRLGMPSRSHIFLGVFATLLLVCVLAPGIYSLLFQRSLDLVSPPSQNDLPALARGPTSMVPPPASVPAAAGAADPSLAAAPVSPRPPAPRVPLPAGQSGIESAVRGRLEAADSLTKDRQATSPHASATPLAPSSQTAAALQRSAVPSVTVPQEQHSPFVEPRVAETGGFVVQFSEWRSEAQAQSTFQELKSKYAILKGREPLVRRLDEGQRGVFYALQVGPFESPDEAEQLCARLKAAGGVCSVSRN